MTEMADKIAAVKAQHSLPKAALVPAIAMAMIAAEPTPSRHRRAKHNTGFFNKREWQAMKKRRKQAQAAKRRNRRGSGSVPMFTERR